MRNWFNIICIFVIYKNLEVAKYSIADVVIYIFVDEELNTNVINVLLKCTVYSAVYCVQCTDAVYSAVYSVQCAVQCTVCSVLMQCIVQCTVQCTVCSVLCAVY